MSKTKGKQAEAMEPDKDAGRTVLSDHITQYPGRGPTDQRQQFVIGLDFGTAFTKVVIGGNRISYAVPFKEYAWEDNTYLLPCTLSIDNEGYCRLGASPSARHQITELKMRLLQGDLSFSTQIDFAAFLALVLRYSRAWFINEHSKIYQDRYLDWLVNVGLPTAHYHDEQLSALYRRIVQAAWTASVIPGPITLEQVADILNQEWLNKEAEAGQDLEQRLIHPEAISVFPEFVAQVTGYVRSPLRQPDLHALVDVGAGTVDVTVFNVFENEDGEDRFPIFAKSVMPLGTQFLIAHRLGLGRRHLKWRPHPHQPFPRSSEFARRMKISPQTLREMDSSFRNQIAKQISEQLIYTKKTRYPNSRKWAEGLPLVLCGGGGKCDFYEELIARFEKEKPPYTVRRTMLPQPIQLEAPLLAASSYDRLSVAYGLSFDPFDLGEIIKASEIDDIQSLQPYEKNYCNRYVDKDMV